MAKAITCSRTGTQCRARHMRGSSKDKTENREECISNLCPSTYFGFWHISNCLNLVQSSIWERKKHIKICEAQKTSTEMWKSELKGQRKEIVWPETYVSNKEQCSFEENHAKQRHSEPSQGGTRLAANLEKPPGSEWSVTKSTAAAAGDRTELYHDKHEGTPTWLIPNAANTAPMEN